MCKNERKLNKRKNKEKYIQNVSNKRKKKNI